MTGIKLKIRKGNRMRITIELKLEITGKKPYMKDIMTVLGYAFGVFVRQQFKSLNLEFTENPDIFIDGEDEPNW